jgi:hypothetical protein
MLVHEFSEILDTLPQNVQIKIHIDGLIRCIPDTEVDVIESFISYDPITKTVKIKV